VSGRPSSGRANGSSPAGLAPIESSGRDPAVAISSGVTDGPSTMIASMSVPSIAVSCPAVYPGRTPTTRQPSAYAATRAANASGETDVTIATPWPGPSPAALSAPASRRTVSSRAPRETVRCPCSNAGSSGALASASSSACGNSGSSDLSCMSPRWGHSFRRQQANDAVSENSQGEIVPLNATGIFDPRRGGEMVS
jgi:hypothetical protein